MIKMLFLKIYLWLMVISIPVLLTFEITDTETLEIMDFLDYFFWAIALVGVFGYCYGKKLLTQKFWKTYLPFVVIWDLFISYTEIHNDPEFSDPILLSVVIILGLIIILPEYIGLYQYGYKTNEST